VLPETTNVKFRPKQSAAPGEGRASKIYDATNGRPFDEKWRVLEFSRLLNSALKLSAECHRPRRLFRPVAFSSQTYRGIQTTSLQWTAECQLRDKICLRNATDQAAPPLNCPRNATKHVAV
jgi:hypothetical protein